MASLQQLAGVKSVAKLAQSRGVRECLQWFTREKQWTNEQHLQVSRIPAPTFLEQQRAEWMASQFRALGGDVQIDGAGNVIARPAGTPGGPFVLLTAHLDTVLHPRTPEEIVVEPDGKLRGPGVSDNSAGLAALLAVGGALASSPQIDDLGAGLLLVANVGEEGEGNLSGMRYLCGQSLPADQINALLVLDGPATGHITCEALESRRFEISFTGPGGHSWSDYGVGNPVHALSRVITLITEQVNGQSPSSTRTSLNFGTIEGGSSINSIPALARAKLDIRSESGQKMDELASLLAASVERTLGIENERASVGKLAARIREIGIRPSGRLPEDAPILTFLREVDSHLGIRSRLDCASTDANIPPSMGLTAVSIGAGGRGGGAHTPSEWFHPEGRDLGLKRILLTLCLLMRNPDLAGSGG
jgi:acetylornithine deacetylase/succinyl-diaminopimelate desuccinylase-like protein